MSTSSAIAASGDDDAKTVAALDLQYQAAVKANDAATIKRLLADDMVLVTGKGSVFKKADFVREAEKKELIYERQDISDQVVRVYGDTAVTTALLSVKGRDAKGDVTEYRVWYSDTYVKRNGVWQYVFGQSTGRLP